MSDTTRTSAVVGAICGSLAAAVATFAAAPVVVLVSDWPRSSVAVLVHLPWVVPTFGLIGVLYVGWLTVPIGGALGSIVGGLAGRRLTTSTGPLPTMAIGALAVGSAWLVASRFDEWRMALVLGALPGALGGGAAWLAGRRITRRLDRARAVDSGESAGASGENGW